ncbi:MAG: hypothetical protein WD423_11570 [Rhodothermales bacterium]
MAQNEQVLTTGFERDVNRYRWTSTARISQQIGSWRLDADNQFQSNAFILFGDRLNFRDENLLTWQVEGPLHGGIDARLRGRSLWYTQSRVFSQVVYSGLRFSPLEQFWIEPAVGFAWDRRPGIGEGESPPLRADFGPAYATRLVWRPSPINDYEIRVDADAAFQVINPRRAREVRVTGDVARRFDDVRLTSHVQYSNFRRDAYQSVSFLNRTTPTDRLSETVEATASDTLLAGLEIEAPLYREVQLTGRIDVGANNRRIRTLRAPEDALFFDTAFNRRSVDGQIGVGYGALGGTRLMGHLSAQGGAEVERRRLTNREHLPATQAAQKSNLLEQADYDEGLLALRARGRAGLGRLTFSFDGSSSIRRHDTPETNRDDRDEVYHNGQVGALVDVNRYLTADVRVLGTFYHTVYLSASRSAENNVQRSLRLRPALTWTPSTRTRLRMGTEIRATYTVHDFTLPGRRAADQSARELRYTAEVEHRFGGGMGLFAEGSASDLQLGRLLWDDFAEIPFDTLRTYSGWVRFQVQTSQGITADVGLRLFIRTDFERSATVRYPAVDDDGTALLDPNGEPIETGITRPGRTIIEQIGPTCSISWPMGGGSSLRVDGWLNVQHVRRALYGQLPEQDVERIRRAAHRGQRKIIPNLSMVASWSL